MRRYRGSVARRRSRPEEGRRALLDAGRALVYERPVGATLEHVRVTDVAARAGVTVGAVYHYWPSQEEYRAALVEDLLSPSRYPAWRAVAATLPDEGEVPLLAAVRTAARLSRESMEASDDIRVTLGFWAAGDHDLGERLANQYREVDEGWVAVYRAVLDRHGLEPRPPFTHHHLAAVLTALIDGLHVRGSLDPQAVPVHVADVDGEPWDLLGAAALAFLTSATRLVGADDDDLWARGARWAAGERRG